MRIVLQRAVSVVILIQRGPLRVVPVVELSVVYLEFVAEDKVILLFAWRSEERNIVT